MFAEFIIEKDTFFPPPGQELYRFMRNLLEVLYIYTITFSFTK